MITAIWYVLRAGLPWRDLPAQFGSWSSVYPRFRRWCAAGLWSRLHAQLCRKAWGQIRSVDCSHIKVHGAGANPAGGQEGQAMGKTKGGLNTKLSAVVDAMGRAVGLCLAPGSQHDLPACRPLMVHLHGQWVLVDRGFDADQFRHDLASSGALICIPPRCGRRISYNYSRRLYRHRHTVENFFARIKRFRRVATRYDKLATSFLAFVLFASVLDWLNFEV
jgi:transposase